jgi:hypothetical protein
MVARQDYRTRTIQIRPDGVCSGMALARELPHYHHLYATTYAQDRLFLPHALDASLSSWTSILSCRGWSGINWKKRPILILVANKSDPAHATDDKQAPVATFKTSLRAWQARYKSQRGTQVAIATRVRRPAPCACSRLSALLAHGDGRRSGRACRPPADNF